MEVGLFFGSFNPIHVGHMNIANLVKKTTPVKEVWFVVSPQNPFKKNNHLLPEFDRLDMVKAAIVDDYSFKISDIEFGMPKPNYTIDTLTLFQNKHPDKKFHLIIGEDNLVSFPRWKNHDRILEHFSLIVYPRKKSDRNTFIEHEKVKMIEAPEMDVSATLIRKLVKQKKSIKHLVTEAVETVIEEQNFFRD